ncbi:MAG: hypothetical protein MZV63_31195 [Marinilabiliales bacterium]|nr:hypothetical protein [Marinilabiliales bacterium]
MRSEEVLHNSCRRKRTQDESPSVPKQFLLLEGKPLLMHTIEEFFTPLTEHIEIILVLPSEHHSLWRGLVREYSFEHKS